MTGRFFEIQECGKSSRFEKTVVINLFYSIQVIKKQAEYRINTEYRILNKDFLNIITVVESFKGVWFPKSRNNLVNQSEKEIVKVLRNN